MSSTIASPSISPDPFRLPDHVRPTRYDVSLRPSLADATFTGRVTIELDVAEPTTTIVLNAIELRIDVVRVDGIDARWTMDESTERMTVTVSEPITAGRATLYVEFAGILNDKLRGFYRSTYLDDDGREHVIATTQMQATDCRRAFPCWDEPAFKAVFGITLDVEDGLTAISNGPEVERTSHDGRTVIRFADTMTMSAYLVAFVVGRLEMTEPIDVDGTPLRVVHVPGKSGLTQFGVDVGSFCLRWFQDYYGIDYPSDKVDLVALPDFAAGAMENLGCITFRENLLLVDPERSTQQERQVVVDVVAHELAHMWFGDLVTMRWWNGIWLNEAFATFMEIAACDAFAPDWERWTSFGLERSVAFDVDSLASTRPVEFEVHSPAEADGMFDVLTYQKGGALLRMLEQYLGADVFRDRCVAYLRTHAYANTETNDLWDAIEATSGEPVRRLMDSWIWQPGFPLVTAGLVDVDGCPQLAAAARNDSAYGDDPTPTRAGSIPVHVRIGSRHADRRDRFERAGHRARCPSPDDLVVVNAGGHGFFRVAYGPELRARLADPASLAQLDTLERYSLVDDAWAATVAGQMPAADLLTLLEGFVDEREYGVWQAVVIATRRVCPASSTMTPSIEFRRRVRDLVAPDAHDRSATRSPGEPISPASSAGQLTRTMGALGQDAATQAACRDIFAVARSGGDVDAELLSAATIVVAVSGDVDAYEQMLDGFTNGVTPQEQLRHLYALAEFDDAELAARTCALAMSDAVKTQNAPFLLRSVIANRYHGPAAWEFVKAHWDEANERFPANSIIRMVDAVKLLTAPGAVDDAARFFADHPIEQAAQTLEQVLERQRVNAALLEREQAAFAAALSGSTTGSR